MSKQNKRWQKRPGRVRRDIQNSPSFHSTENSHRYEIRYSTGQNSWVPYEAPYRDSPTVPAPSTDPTFWSSTPVREAMSVDEIMERLELPDDD